MNPNDEARDEKQIALLLSAMQKDAAPPDDEFLARLRAQSTDTFVAAALQVPSPVAKKRPMIFGFISAFRSIAAAIVAIFGVSLYFWLGAGATGVALGDVLEKTEQANTLHLHVRLGDAEQEFWHSRSPQRSRWDERAGNYRIADGANYWVVNESANEALRTTPPPDSDRPVHQFLHMLGVPADQTKILDSQPVERKRDGNTDLLIYRGEIVRREGTVSLEAVVYADTLRLHTLRTRFERAGLPVQTGELTVVAYDEPIGIEKFAIADTLTEDGRIGKITDVQGIVTLKPVVGQRWSPVRENLVLRPGDWVRTDARGANAAALRLVKQVGVILGPKTLVELVGPTTIRMIEGEIEVNVPAGATLDLLGPGTTKSAVKGQKLFRIDKEQLAPLAKEPPWLLGFKGATTNETLGSLVALVDGRNVPLSVGYHKVTVDIRDQIARTVIEESFVNHTDSVLEGVFHFPLPQDASISGFGMWIGDNLVEADVVEKQRAREIYETILRERRDPGLLEWSGGNIFKARVFPIAAHSEKRIKITYTQVLPLKGSRYRYSYALQSELLQQHPLRELSIDVKVNSVVPLKSVTSPTHATRNEKTTHSGHVEFTAQEYTPSRDFEVVVEVEGRQADVVMIPHRRGDDGYFMLQLTPPGTTGDWDRALLGDTDPLQLLILADTSASIDTAQRATQATFIGALLSSLGPKDTFNLGACDVACDWAFLKPAPADAKNVDAARTFLGQRVSLGWTDLDAAFAAALKQAGPKTHVIYVGDGIVTTGDADPVAFTKRLRRLYQGHSATFHAVSLGSSYESGVLKAIASLGGGSMRKITGEQGPQAVALELLGEIGQPALRNVKVEFKGMSVARLYPETLANVPAGSQQILLGRYLPTGAEQAGEVIVTGLQGGKPVKFSTKAVLKDAESGNSFIPRLWARMHLDSLLEQGTSDSIKDEIIALSEEYQIITPYTSFLVLETDADRERFKVKRRFQMRDGERFFADGRDHAVFDLTQKQMKLAGAWRTALRRDVLSELARLGREPRLFQPPVPRRFFGNVHISDTVSVRMGLEDSLEALSERPMERGGRDAVYSQPDDEFSREITKYALELSGGEIESRFNRNATYEEEESIYLGNVSQRSRSQKSKDSAGDFLFDSDAPSLFGTLYDRLEGAPAASGANSVQVGGEFGEFVGARGTRSSYVRWLDTLFPPLSAPPGKVKEVKSTWPAEARELAQSLLRTSQLATLSGGLAITRKTEHFDPRWGDVTSRSTKLELASAKSWLKRTESDGGQTLVSWCDGAEMGIYSKDFQLGRTRAAVPLDVQPPPLELDDYSLAALDVSLAGYLPTLQPQGANRTLLILKHASSPFYETRMLIDTARHVLLSIENRAKDKTTGLTKFDDFVEAAGSWWARRVETTNEDGKLVSLVTQTIDTPTLQELDRQMQAELAGRAQVQLLHLPMPSLLKAKEALAANRAKFDDHFVLLYHFALSQQWSRVFDHLQVAEKLAPGRPGLRWLRSALLYDSRRHEELRQRFLEEAPRLAKAGSYFLADCVERQSANVLQASEMLTLLDLLKPVYDAAPAHVNARKRWQEQRANYLSQARRNDEALLVQKQLATDFPRDSSLQQEYANGLATAGDYPAAYAWLTRVLVKESKWTPQEEGSLRYTYVQLLQRQGRYPESADYLAAWVEQNPPDRSAYEQYLSALIKSDLVEKADTLALKWLKEAQVPGELAPDAEGRLYAAIQLMLGQVQQIYTNRVEDRWLAPLAQAVLFFARDEAHYYSVQTILSSSQFNQSEEGERTRKALASIFVTDIDKMPAVLIWRLLDWVRHEDLEPATWQTVAGVLRSRWAAEPDDNTKHLLGQALVHVLSNHGDKAEALAFLRLRWQQASEMRRAEYANALFNALLEQPWSTVSESEALTMLDKLSSADEPGARLLSFVEALHRATDKLLENRLAARMKTLEHPEKLTRSELQKKKDDIERTERASLADRLRQEAGNHPKERTQWLSAESIYLDVLLDRNLTTAAAEAWEVVGAAPIQLSGEPTIEQVLDNILRQRYLVTLANLAARKNAEPALVDRLVKYFDAGIATQPEEARWKLAKYRLLVALDRPKEMEEALRQWTKQNDADSRWRLSLGYLLAEQGHVAEAIAQFEAVEAADELTPAGYRTLSEWYLVRNQRAEHERAALAVYQTVPERILSNAIAIKLQPWHRRDVKLPTELDIEVLRIFAVLFDKSASPQDYLYSLQQFYQACHDFRLLAVLPDAVVGHTAGRVYPFLQGMHSVLGEIRDEATADELVSRIATVRLRAKTAVDQRALDLLEVLVERRAAEVQNQPGPHIDKALTALQRAFKRDWSPGEPRLMADFLASLNHISAKSLADEQLRQLKSLHTDATPGSLDRLHIAHRYAITLNSYSRSAEAIDLLQTALDEYQAANAGTLPVMAHDVLATFISYLESAGHFARGEKVLVDHLQRPIHAEQRRWLIERLDEVYLRALQNDGEVSLGKGDALYRSLEIKIQRELDDNDDNHRYHLVGLACQVFRAAQNNKLPNVVVDLNAFAFNVLPPILKQQSNHYDELNSTVAQTLHDIAGPRDAISFLITQIETEPRWLHYNNQDGWNRHASSLAEWRLEAKDLGEVENRLLKLVLKELRRDLETRENRSRNLYHQQNYRYWKEKETDFVKVAEEVLAERSQSGAAVQYIADYLYSGVNRPSRAIEILFTAHSQKLLNEAGQAKLIDFLHGERRFGESIALSLSLIERRPENLSYRVHLMRAYFHTSRNTDLVTLLKQTDAYFHEKNRWTEDALSQLARSTLENELYEPAVAYYKELIPRHESTEARRGIGDGTLSAYYMGLANAYAGLKKTSEAVDAASGAIVAWGPRSDNRDEALRTLKAVLLQAPDLDAFARSLDQKKQDSAIVRKALGQTYSDKREFAKAIEQLKVAESLQPNDGEIYRLLVESYDKMGDKAGALQQLLQAVQFARRDLKLYRDLGERYIAANLPTEAERAYTSIVEVMPTESESHAALAEIREKQNRWPDAIAHWEQVARLTALEPTGLLKLAEAQIHEKEWDNAQETLHKLSARTWPSRFSDVDQRVRALEAQVTKGRK